jgi:hypothetical protein
VTVLGLLGLYFAVLRRRVMTWGASRDDAGAPLPGDELLDCADGVSTRAIEIDAAPTAVWPWIAQMGPEPRGGAYTYDWVENLLGLNMHSADRVLAWRSESGDWVWSFILRERNGRTTLISRNRFRLPTVAARLGMLPMEPASLVMERKMLRGIKQRAERLASAAASGSR